MTLAITDNIAAEAKGPTPKDISFHRKALTAVTVFIVILWFFSKPQHLEAWAMRIVTIASVLATAALWSTWRHKLYAVSFLFLTFAMAWLLAEDFTHHSVLGWIVTVSMPLLFLYSAFQWWKRAVARNSTDSGVVK